MGAVVDEEKKKLKTRISGKKKSLALQQEIEKLLQQKKEVDEGIKLKRPVYRKKFLEELAEKVIAVCNMEEDDKVCDEPIEFRQCRDRIVEKIKYWKNIAEAQSQNNDDVNGNAENEKNESGSAAILKMGDVNGDAENEKNESE